MSLQMNLCGLRSRHGHHLDHPIPGRAEGARAPRPAEDAGDAAHRRPSDGHHVGDSARLNTGSTSYHLRQLAQHGFVEEDPERGNARDRWWRAAHQSTTTDTAAPADPDERETLEAYLQSVVVVMTQTLQRSVEELSLLPKEWGEATTYSDWMIRLTPQRALALVERLMAIIKEVQDEAGEEGEDAEQYVVQLNGFPYPGKVGRGLE